jgi:hypothetical protein
MASGNRDEASARARREIWALSGGRCAFAECRKELIFREGGLTLSLGKVAHIVAASPDGPRGKDSVPGGDRSAEANLLLLCPTHHDLIDAQPKKYTTQRLIGIKETHERWVAESLCLTDGSEQVGELVEDTVHSTLLAVEALPPFVYLADTSLSEDAVKPLVQRPQGKRLALPYIVRGGKLLTFTVLDRAPENPFHHVIDADGAIEKISTAGFLEDPDLARWVVSLLNRTLNKLTGWRHLQLDKDHGRYFFPPEDSGDGIARPRKVVYRALNQQASRLVAWRPTTRATGEGKRHWIHLAVSLHFHRVTPSRWVLALRPERRFTVDGKVSLAPKAVGRKATSAKAHMYNLNVLKELQFWREYLSDGQQHLVLDFGGQTMVIDTSLRSVSVRWPGVPEDATPFANTSHEDDLFSSAEYLAALESTDEPAAMDDAFDPREIREFEALRSANDKEAV